MRQLNNEELHSEGDHIEENEMDVVCSKYDGEEKCRCI